MTDRTGQQFGHYLLTRLLGHGGFADVYLGEHIYLGTLAAIKVLKAQLSLDEIEQFHQEARTIAQLEHPHIVRVLDFGVEEQQTPFLVMSYAPKGSLRFHYPRGQHVPLKKIVNYVKQIAGALQYAHDEKLIHRDVKPENMLVGRNDEILLSDFGLAIVASTSSQDGLRDISGTVAYMAPEQARGKPRAASDQYSLGVIVYEWLCGTRPFEGSYQEIAVQHVMVAPPPLHQSHPTISPLLEEVVLKALAKDPHQRYLRIQDFAEALEQACQDEKSPSLMQPVQVKLPSDSGTVTNRIPSDTVYALMLSPDGKRFAAGGLERTVQIRATTTGVSNIIYRGHSGSISALSWSANGQLIASASLDKTIQVWNPTNGQRVSTYNEHAGMIYALAWSPDGYSIASTSGGGTDNSVQIWESASGQNIFTYHDPAYWSRAVAWSPNGKQLAIGSWREILLWDVARKSKLGIYHGHHSWIRAIAWSPDGKRIASACEDKLVHIWDLAKERPIATHRDHTDWVSILAWSPDSKRIAAVGKDNTIYVWDTTTGTSILTHHGQNASAFALLWLPDGKHIVSAYSSGTTQIKLFSV